MFRSLRSIIFVLSIPCLSFCASKVPTSAQLIVLSTTTLALQNTVGQIQALQTIVSNSYTIPGSTSTYTLTAAQMSDIQAYYTSLKEELVTLYGQLQAAYQALP